MHFAVDVEGKLLVHGSPPGVYNGRYFRSLAEPAKTSAACCSDGGSLVQWRPDWNIPKEENAVRTRRDAGWDGPPTATRRSTRSALARERSQALRNADET